MDNVSATFSPHLNSSVKDQRAALRETEAKAHLPGCETGGAHQVPTRFNLHILVVLSTDFTQLEGGAHLTVQLILFLRERQHK